MGRMKLLISASAAVAIAAIAGGYAVAQALDSAPHPGKAVYDASCAACHANPAPGDRAVPVAGLRKMSASTLMAALTTGIMKPIGDGLTPQQRRDVVAYLAAPDTGRGTAWLDAARCAADKRDVDLSAAPAQTGFGGDIANTRSMTAKQAGLKAADLRDMEVAWTLAMPKTTALRGQGVVVGSTLFYPAGQSGQVLALDTKTGCIKWNTPVPGMRNSLAYGRLGKDGPMALVGAEGQGFLFALDAKTGKQIWRVDPRHDKSPPISGTVIFAGDKIIVPISSLPDVAAAQQPKYECCKVHGAVAAVEAATGKLQWTWHTMEDAKPLGRTNSAGTQLYGPSGAPIWSSPAADLKRGIVYTATGENTSPPGTKTSDSIVAIDLATGKEKWVFQALANDIWNMSCPVGIDATRTPGANCFFNKEGSVLLDHDFGGGPVLAKGKGGKDVVLGGQKSGDVWALNADDGKVLWHHQFGKGTALGGVHWGIASDGKRVYAPISDPTVAPEKSAAGMYAIDIASGKVAWQWRSSADCSPERKARVSICGTHHGLSAPPIVIDGAVVAGSLDGRLYVWDGAGKVVATYDTAVPFTSHTGLKGNGGSIDAAGPFAGDGMLFVGSGYASFGQAAGNVLVAYRPKSK